MQTAFLAAPETDRGADVRGDARPPHRRSPSTRSPAAGSRGSERVGGLPRSRSWSITGTSSPTSTDYRQDGAASLRQRLTGTVATSVRRWRWRRWTPTSS